MSEDCSTVIKTHLSYKLYKLKSVEPLCDLTAAVWPVPSQQVTSAV